MKSSNAGISNIILYVLLGLLGIVIALSLLWSFNVPATKIGVVENRINGALYVVGPGLHIWPLSPSAVPLVTSHAIYDLRRQIIEIGGSPAREKGVQADSASPGRPNVYFFARGWAYPNKDAIIELHKKYGPKYLDDWVERVWVSALKGIQGGLEYDFVGLHRVEMQDIVEKALQAELLGSDAVPLVFVSQLAIVDFDYDAQTAKYLDEVAAKQFERQVQEQQAAVNTKAQEAARISSETDYITKKRGAEAKAVESQVGADAEAYKTKVIAEAQAEAVRVMQEALKSAPDSMIDYLWVQKWNGTLPQYNMGNSVPLVGIP